MLTLSTHKSVQNTKVVNIKLILLFVFVLSSTACALLPPEVKIDNKMNLRPLENDELVTVFTKKEPTFGYEVACSADVTVKRYRYSLDDYSSDAEEIARECGTTYAMVTNMSSFQYGDSVSSRATVKAIVKTTEESKAAAYINNNPDFIKKIVTAAQVGNVKNLKLLLDKAQFMVSVKGRPPVESGVLNELASAILLRGEHCSKATLAVIIGEYGAKINSLKRAKINFEQPLECSSPFIGQSFEDLKDKPAEIKEINIVISTKLNNGLTSGSSLVAYKNFLQLYPALIKEVNQSCDKEQTSELCSLKPNFIKIKQLSSKVLRNQS